LSMSKPSAAIKRSHREPQSRAPAESMPVRRVPGE
jgi:hypothetical protein